MPSREFKWTKKRVLPAAFLAENELSDEKIAGIVGVSRNTIAMWKLNPVFAQRVNLVTTWERKVMNSGIANKARRVRALNEIHNRQMQIVEERSTDVIFTAKDQEGQPIVPGGGTGLMVIGKFAECVGGMEMGDLPRAAQLVPMSWYQMASPFVE